MRRRAVSVGLVGAHARAPAAVARAASIVLLLALVSCGSDAPDELPACVRELGGRVDGPRYVRRILESERASVDTKVSAAIGLLESPRRDVDAPSLVAEAVRGLAREARTDVSAGLLIWIDGAIDTDEERHLGMRATELLVGLELPPDEAAPRLVRWYSGGPTRFGGRVVAADALRPHGPGALGVILDATDAPLLPPHLVALIDALADDEALRAYGERRLLDNEAAAYGPALEPWLRERLLEVLEEQGRSDRPADFLDRVVAVNRVLQRERSLEALAPRAEQRAVQERLLARGVDRAGDVSVRTAALRALIGHATESTGARLLALGVDTTEPAALRDLALDVVDSVPALAPSVEDRFAQEREPRLRGRLGVIALHHGGPARARRVLEEGLPAGPYRVDELLGYGAAIAAMEAPALAAAFVASSDPHLALIGAAAGGDRSRLAGDARPLDVTDELGPRTLGQAATELGDRLGRAPNRIDSRAPYPTTRPEGLRSSGAFEDLLDGL